VKAGTLGAEKVTETGSTYFIVWKEAGRTKREATGLTDKRAAQKYHAEWLTARERGQVGLTDPFKVHLDRPAGDHLAEYVAAVRDDRGRSAEYVAKLGKELGNILSAARVTQLRDLSADRVREYLSGLKVKATTKNKHRTYLFTFCKWLVKRDRLPSNPIDKVDTARRQAEEKRRRRSLKPKELRSLLSAVSTYPFASRAVNKGGRPRKDGTRPAPAPAKLSDATRADLALQGRERVLWYRVALLTGLRRGELSRVQIRHVKLKRGVIDLPAALTKNRRRAVIPLPASLTAALRQWVSDTARGPDDTLFAIPDAATMSLMHQRHVAYAGIPYETAAGFADWHGLRKTTNTFLRRKKVALRLRQRFLRHTAADLATGVYDDERVKEMRPVVDLLARLDSYLTRRTDQDAAQTQTPPAAAT
jgi:integrase